MAQLPKPSFCILIVYPFCSCDKMPDWQGKWDTTVVPVKEVLTTFKVAVEVGNRDTK